MEAIGTRSGDEVISLEFKSASPSTSPLMLRVLVSSTIAELKVLLKNAHPLHPDIGAQRLIFAGRLLGDDERLDLVLPKHHYDRSVAHSMHLVLRSTSAATSTPTSPLHSSPMGHSTSLSHSHSNFQFNAMNAHANAFGNYAVPPPYAVPGAYPVPFMPYPHNAGPGIGLGPALAPVPGPVPMPGVAHGGQGQGAQGQAQGAGRPHAVMAARVIQIDFSLILKLALGVYFLSQGGGEQRLAFLIACAIAFYIYQAGLGRRIEFDERGNPIDPQPQPRPNNNDNANHNNNANNDNANEADPSAQLEAERRAREVALSSLPFWAREMRGSVGRQIAAFFAPLFLSLNPHWTLPDLSIRDTPLPQIRPQPLAHGQPQEAAQ